MIHLFCNLEEISEGEPLPYCDMTFEILSSHYDEDRYEMTLEFGAEADLFGAVGFAAVIPTTGWHEQINRIEGAEGDETEAFRSWWGGVALVSRGAESDRLLALMADYFDVTRPSSKRGVGLANLLRKKQPAWTFVNRIECLAMGIMSDPSTLREQAVHMKLFMDDGIKGGRYAEVVFDIDIGTGFAFLNEKDEEYREDLVHWLSRSGLVNANPHPGSGGVVLQ